MDQAFNWNIKIEGVRDFNLKEIFDCGQCFRWEHLPEDESIWQGLAGAYPAAMKYDESLQTLHIADMAGAGEAFWRNYLDLDRDYGAIKKLLEDGDEAMAEAIKCGSGIRILKQEPWEALVSFIISQNNNIPRIKKCINYLAAEIGEPINDGLYALPSAQDLAKATIEDLAPCRLGYRAKYLIEAGRQISEDEGFLARLQETSVDGAKAAEELQKICGVGPKVANCIALFGLNKLDCFPLDVWMKRVMNQVYGIPENDVKAMRTYAEEHFGQYGGIAQQYLFNFIARA